MFPIASQQQWQTVDKVSSACNTQPDIEIFQTDIGVETFNDIQRLASEQQSSGQGHWLAIKENIIEINMLRRNIAL